MTPEEFEKNIDTVGSGTPLEAAYQKITEARLLMAHMKSKSTAEKTAVRYLYKAARIIAEILTEQEAQP